MGGYANRSEVITRLKIATALCSCFLVVEAIGGYIAGSLAVLSDAAHLFADLAGFAVAIAASYLADMPASECHTYGLKRSESLAALLTMLSLVFVSVGLAIEAIMRLYVHWYASSIAADVDGPIMSLVAGIGVVVNVVLALVLGEHHIHLPGADHCHDHDHGGGGCSSHGHDHGGHGNAGTTDRGGGVDSGASSSHGHIHEHATSNHGHSHEHVSTTDHASSPCHENEHSHSHNSHQKQDSSGATTDSTHSHAHNQHSASENDNLLERGLSSTCSGGGGHGSIAAKSATINNTRDSDARARNVNLHAAYIHVLGDLAQSAAVFAAGLIIWFKPEWAILDPIITLLFCALVLMSTVNVLKSSVSVLLEQVPSNVSFSTISQDIAAVSGVSKVHALHIWSISHGEPALSLHCCTTNDPGETMRQINRICLDHGIRHSTLQVQPADAATNNQCLTCDENENCLCH